MWLINQSGDIYVDFSSVRKIFATKSAPYCVEVCESIEVGSSKKPVIMGTYNRSCDAQDVLAMIIKSDNAGEDMFRMPAVDDDMFLYTSNGTKGHQHLRTTGKSK